MGMSEQALQMLGGNGPVPMMTTFSEEEAGGMPQVPMGQSEPQGEPAPFAPDTGLPQEEPQQNPIVQQVSMQILALVGQWLTRQDLNVEVQAKSIYTLTQAYEKLNTAQPQQISAEDQMQLEIVKLQFEQQMEQQKFELEVQKMQMEAQIKQQQAEQDAQIKQQTADQQLRHAEESHENAQRQQDEKHRVGTALMADKHNHNKQMDETKLQQAANKPTTKSSPK